MSLLKYFSWVKIKDGLLDPTGSLSGMVPSTSIEEVNKEVSAELMVAMLEQKAKVRKYAAENRSTKA